MGGALQIRHIIIRGSQRSVGVGRSVEYSLVVGDACALGSRGSSCKLAAWVGLVAPKVKIMTITPRFRTHPSPPHTTKRDAHTVKDPRLKAQYRIREKRCSNERGAPSNARSATNQMAATCLSPVSARRAATRQLRQHGGTNRHSSADHGRVMYQCRSLQKQTCR